MTRTIAFTIATWLVVAIVGFPIFWIIATSLKPPAELFTVPPKILPVEPTFLNYSRVLWQTDFLTYFGNSLFVACCVTILVVAAATCGAYALLAFELPGSAWFSRAVLFSYLLPSSVLLIPVYLTISRLGLVNSLVSVVLAHTTFALPFALSLMRSFFLSVPKEIELAARVDGASRPGAFFDVVIPQVLPGIITTAVFTFLLSWNEFLFALVLINDGSKKTLPTGIMSTLVVPHDIEWGMVMASSLLTTLPLFLAFVLLQRFIVAGFSAGAVKG